MKERQQKDHFNEIDRHANQEHSERVPKQLLEIMFAKTKAEGPPKAQSRRKDQHDVRQEMDGKIQDKYDDRSRESILNEEDIQASAESKGPLDENKDGQNERRRMESTDKDQKDKQHTAAASPEKDQKNIFIRITYVDEITFT